MGGGGKHSSHRQLAVLAPGHAPPPHTHTHGYTYTYTLCPCHIPA